MIHTGKNGNGTGAAIADANDRSSQLIYSSGAPENTGQFYNADGGEESFSDDVTEGEADDRDSFEDLTGTGEETGSPRYVLSREIVQKTYEPLGAHFASLPIPIQAHILPASDRKTEVSSWYEDGLKDLTALFPLRLARLRDLYGRVHEARAHRCALEAREEAIRVHFNKRNNDNNERLEKEIALLQKEWQERRKVCEAYLVTVRAELIKRETGLREKATEAQESLWQLRGTLAAEQDAEAKQDREREQERESTRLVAEQEISLLEQKQRVDCRNKQEDTRLERLSEINILLQEADAELRKAAEGVQAVRESAAGTRSEAIDLAETALAKARFEVLLEWEHETQKLRERAEAAEAELRQWVQTCAEDLAQVKRDAAKRQGELDAEAAAAERERIKSAARAGVAVQDLDDMAPRDALFANRPTSKTGDGGAPEEYLDSQEESKTESGRKTGFVDRVMRPGFEGAALLGFGAVFSISLGLLLHLFTGSTLIERPVQLIIMLAIGTSIFFIMGKTVSHVVSLAVEAWDTHPGQTRTRAVCATVFAFLTVFLLIGIEAVIEKHGIVDTFIKSSGAFALGQSNGADVLSADKELAYWMMALLAAAPFTLYHAFGSWRQATQRVASARNRARHSVESAAFLDRPEAREMLAAHGHALDARRRAETGCAESQIRLHDSELRLAEAQKATHPDTERWAAFKDRVATFVEEHPKVQSGKEDVERLQTPLEDQPSVQAAQSRQRFWEGRIGLHREQLMRDFGETLERGAEDIVGHLADSAGDALGITTDALAAKTAGFSLTDVMQAIVPESGGVGRSNQEGAAKQQLEECLAQIAEDPQVRYGQERIRSLQARLQRMEENYKKRILSLKKQRRAIELRPGQYLGPELADAATQIQAAQYLFECEYSRLLRLSELPGFMRFFVQVWQNTVRPDFVTAHVEQATKQLASMPPPIFNSPHRSSGS